MQGDHAIIDTSSREPYSLSMETEGTIGKMADEGLTGTRVSAKANVRKRFVGIRSFTGPKSNKLAGEIICFFVCLPSCTIARYNGQHLVFRP